MKQKINLDGNWLLSEKDGYVLDGNPLFVFGTIRNGHIGAIRIRSEQSITVGEKGEIRAYCSSPKYTSLGVGALNVLDGDVRYSGGFSFGSKGRNAGKAKSGECYGEKTLRRKLFFGSGKGLFGGVIELIAPKIVNYGRIKTHYGWGGT